MWSTVSGECSHVLKLSALEVLRHICQLSVQTVYSPTPEEVLRLYAEHVLRLSTVEAMQLSAKSILQLHLEMAEDLSSDSSADIVISTEQASMFLQLSAEELAEELLHLTQWPKQLVALSTAGAHVALLGSGFFM